MSDDDVKTVLAWGSVSYAFGFVIVMLHTWRLGFPVLDLLSGRYIWIGLPLTFLAFFARWIVRAATKRSLVIAEELKNGWEHLKGRGKTIVTTGELVKLLLKILPGSWLYGWLLRWMFRQEALENALRTRPSGAYVRFFGAFVYFGTALSRALNAINIAILVTLAVAFYVWVGYPLIPQSLGGGLPLSVQLVVSTEKAQAVLPSLGVLPVSATKTALTPTIRLLYITGADYYLEIGSGKRMSLSKDSVSGVLWNP
jgi:hypothetical protein